VITKKIAGGEGRRGAPPLGIGVMVDSIEIRIFPTCYRAEFGRSKPSGMGVRT